MKYLHYYDKLSLLRSIETLFLFLTYLIDFYKIFIILIHFYLTLKGLVYCYFTGSETSKLL